MAHLAKWAGCIYVAPVAEDGTLQGPWEELGEAAPLSIQLQDEEPTTRRGRTCKTYGKIIASRPNPGTATGSLTMFEYTAHNVARALKGMVETTNVPTETLSDKAVELKEIGQYVEIGAEELSGVTVTGSGGAALTEGTDYEINTALGLISAKTAATANTTVSVSGEAAAYAEPRVVIGANTSGKYAVKGLLINEFTGKQAKLHLYKVLFTSNGEVVLLSEDDTEAQEIAMTLTPEIPTGGSTYGTIDGLPLRVSSV